jgi:ABC-2 type transport system permease protein
VILGKFFGTLVFYLALVATTLVHLILMEGYADPIGSVVCGGYLGLILLGGLFIAIGLFASCCTRHQLLAALLAVAVLSIFTFVADYGAEFARQPWQRNVCSYLNVFGHFADFSKGMIDTKSLIFFLSGTGFFLFLATKVLESRRWR